MALYASWWGAQLAGVRSLVVDYVTNPCLLIEFAIFNRPDAAAIPHFNYCVSSSGHIVDDFIRVHHLP
jgi:hypothetical protein